MPSLTTKKIQAREIAQGDIIQAAYKKLGKCKPEDMVAAIDNRPSRKKIDKMEAKNNFLLEKMKKLREELDEQKKQNQETINRLNVALPFNQKLEEYVSFLSDVLNKARLFNNNMAKNLVLAPKIISILVDFVEKMEELLDDMRSLFDRLAPEGNLEVPLENVPDISGNIPSLTGWGKESEPTASSTKPDQLGPFEPTRETEKEEVLSQPKYKSPPRRRIVEPMTTRREIQVNDMVERVIEELEEEHNQPHQSETLC